MVRIGMSVLLVAGALAGTCGAGHAQSWQTRSMTLAMRGGETQEVGDLYWVSDCQSLLKSPPQASILSGPPGVTVEVKEDQVMPRHQLCPRPVKGGKLFLKAGDIEDESVSLMTIRVSFDTKDGPRQVSYDINLSLFPAQ